MDWLKGTYFNRKTHENPMIFMGKSMVSEDVPGTTNPLR
jgi:hypothetical protein